MNSGIPRKVAVAGEVNAGSIILLSVQKSVNATE
jgi:hypothetical protein